MGEMRVRKMVGSYEGVDRLGSALAVGTFSAGDDWQGSLESVSARYGMTFGFAAERLHSCSRRHRKGDSRIITAERLCFDQEHYDSE